jgi:hypothetical protein
MTFAEYATARRMWNCKLPSLFKTLYRFFAIKHFDAKAMLYYETMLNNNKITLFIL